MFFLFFALPADPAELIASQGGQRAPDPQVVENIRQRFGLDDPVPVQYVKYLGRMVQGDLGKSYRSGTEVTSLIKDRLPTSMRLAFWAMCIEASIGISSGMLSARKRNSIADASTTVGAVVLSAIPVFLLAFLIRQVTGVYAFQHGWPEWAKLPVLGFGPDKWILGVLPTFKQVQFLIQPAFVVATVSTAIVARLTRTSMLETSGLDHVRTARAKGLTESRVQRRHVLRNALIPVVTFIGIDFGTIVGAAVLTETVFNIQGLGSSIVQAAGARDLPVVLGLSMVVILVYGVANLAVDMSYAYLDPRIRYGRGDA
jgi:ABC-type dipeptide/oligopeptide/nickel transport system permease component